MTYKICRKPFEWMELFHSPKDSMYLCCPGWLPVSTGSFESKSFDELWRNERAQKIRMSVIDGSFKYCNSYCPYIENHDLPDSPIEYVSEEEYQSLRLAAQYPQDYLPGPETINLAYDRSCNLKCPSCRRETITAEPAEGDVYDAYFLDILMSYGSEPVTLYITGGGDAFASLHYRSILESDLLRRATNIRLRLHTNAIMLTEKRWDGIKHLHDRIDFIEISMDGARKESYEYNRFPAKWETFKKRMDFVKTVKQKWPHIELKINFVLQTNNYRDVPLLIDYAHKWGVDMVKISMLDNWGTYSQEEFEQASVHRQSHPEHKDLIKVLTNKSVIDADNLILDTTLYDISRRIPLLDMSLAEEVD